jgi:Ni/Co efflux regulator RcnB
VRVSLCASNLTILLDVDSIFGLWRREEFSIDLRRHEQSANTGASNQVDPDRAPTKVGLQGAHRQKTNGSSDGSGTIDETSHSSKRFIVTANRWMRGQIRSNGRGDNIIGSEENQGRTNR